MSSIKLVAQTPTQFIILIYWLWTLTVLALISNVTLVFFLSYYHLINSFFKIFSPGHLKTSKILRMITRNIDGYCKSDNNRWKINPVCAGGWNIKIWMELFFFSCLMNWRQKFIYLSNIMAVLWLFNEFNQALKKLKFFFLLIRQHKFTIKFINVFCLFEI